MEEYTDIMGTDYKRQEEAEQCGFPVVRSYINIGFYLTQIIEKKLGRIGQLI